MIASNFGWTGKILNVDLSERTISNLQTADYWEKFIGGLGIAQKIYWDTTSPETSAFDPDNPLIMMTGPLCGTTAPAASRMAVCGKSPCTYPERFVNASIAGFFPAELKKAGFDGIVLTGRADKPVYIYINNNQVAIRDATPLWGLNNRNIRAFINKDTADSSKILSIGSGCDKGSRIGNIMGDLGGSASMGFGSVMGSKNLKGIAATGSGRIGVAYPEGVNHIRERIREMTGSGWHNIYAKTMPVADEEAVRKLYCHGCPQGCWRSLHRRASGLEGIRKCHMGMFYGKWDIKLNGSITDSTFLATELVNDYSLCTDEILFLLLWLEKCFEQNILTEEQAELPVSKMGSTEFIETMMKKISDNEGFGKVLAQGALRASEIIGRTSRQITRDFLTSSGRPARTYGPKSFIMSVPVFAVEQRPAITTLHEICNPLTKWALWLKSSGRESYVSTGVLQDIAERFWGSKQAVDFSTTDGKALAAKHIQDRQYAKECLILCDLVFPIMDDTAAQDHVGDPTLESSLLSAVTGIDITEQELNLIGERVFNLNRSIQIRDGRKGREDDVLSETYFIKRQEPPSDIFDIYNPERFLPNAKGELLSHKDKPLDRSQAGIIMDEYYRLRGWNKSTGLIEPLKLKELGLEDIVSQ